MKKICPAAELAGVEITMQKLCEVHNGLPVCIVKPCGGVI